MKKIFLLIFLFTGVSKSQNEFSFIAQIPNTSYVPEVSHFKNGLRINKTKTPIRKLNRLMNSYKIYVVKQLFKNSEKVSLKNLYLIKCNDSNLIKILKINYNNYYPTLLDLNGNDLDKMFPLPAIPNDYIINDKLLEVNQGDVKGSVKVDQDELNYIRAPEAWQVSKGSSDVIIGISDQSYDYEHEDLKNKITHVFGKNHPNTSSPHGSYVASVAAADTNNNTGMASIGNRSHIYMATSNHTAGVDTLSKIKEVKVISTAWVTSKKNASIFNKAFGRGKVIVAAAGNGGRKGPEKYIYPAAFKNVISVSGIGHHNHTFIRNKQKQRVLEDTHQQNRILKHGGWSHQHNDSVDIVAPSYGILLAKSNLNGKSTYANEGVGTSYAAPIVSGTIALMFDVNYCLKPKEIETILKLTAVKIDTLPQNKAFYGKLGAGKLDAYRAVKMAKDMADEFGIVEVKDRILYRWFYKLETAPYEIKMTNNDVTGNARLKLKARNGITIKKGNYKPQKGGYIDLRIKKDLALNDCTPRPSSYKKSVINSNQIKHAINDALFEVSPISFDDYVTFSKREKEINNITSILIFNVLEKKVYEKSNINSNSIKMNLEHLENGVYFVKIFNDQKTIGVKKIFKN